LNLLGEDVSGWQPQLEDRQDVRLRTSGQ